MIADWEICAYYLSHSSPIRSGLKGTRSGLTNPLHIYEDGLDMSIQAERIWQLAAYITTADSRRYGNVYKVSRPCFQPHDSSMYCLPKSTTFPLADTLLQRRFYRLRST